MSSASGFDLFTGIRISGPTFLSFMRKCSTVILENKMLDLKMKLYLHYENLLVLSLQFKYAAATWLFMYINMNLLLLLNSKRHRFNILQFYDILHVTVNYLGFFLIMCMTTAFTCIFYYYVHPCRLYHRSLCAASEDRSLN